MKYFSMFTILVLILVCLALEGSLYAQTNIPTDKTPELVPFTDADTQLDADMTRAVRIYTDLMWAVYCRTGEYNIRKAKAAYDALIEELKFNGESVEDKVLSAHDASFIYTERAALRFLPKLQDINGAEEDARRAIQLDPGSVNAKLTLVKILDERFKFYIKQNSRGTSKTRALQEEILSVGKQIVKLDPDHSGGHYYLSSAARFLGQIELAITSFKALTRILPFIAEYHWQLAELYEKQNRLEEALQSYERVVTIRPELKGVWNRIGQLYLQTAELYEKQNRLEEALQSYERVVTIYPELKGVWNRIGQLYLQTGDYSASVRTFLTVLEPLEVSSKDDTVEQTPRNFNDAKIEAHQGLSLAYEAQDNFEKAEYHIIQSITLLEESARSMRGGTRTNRVRSRDRIELAQKIQNAYHTLAHIYLRFNFPKKAAQTFEKILEDNANYVPALTGIGIAYQMLDDVKRAENYLRKAVELPSTKEVPDAYNALGYLYAEQGIKLDEAETLVRRALKSAPTSGAYLDSLGLIYFKQGKLDAAIENLEQALRYLPDTPEILSHLADAYLEKGLEQKALQTLEHAVRLEPDNAELQQKLDTIKLGR